MALALVMQNLPRFSVDYLKIQEHFYVRLQKPETLTLLIFIMANCQLTLNTIHAVVTAMDSKRYTFYQDLFLQIIFVMMFFLTQQCCSIQRYFTRHQSGSSYLVNEIQ